MTINSNPHGALHLNKGYGTRGKMILENESQTKKEGYLRLHYSVSTTIHPVRINTDEQEI